MRLVGFLEFPAPADQERRNTAILLESQELRVFSSICKEFRKRITISLGLRYDNFEKEMQRPKGLMSSLLPPARHTTPTISRKDFSPLSPSFQWERSFQQELNRKRPCNYAEKPGGFSAYTDNAPAEFLLKEETHGLRIQLYSTVLQNLGG